MMISSKNERVFASLFLLPTKRAGKKKGEKNRSWLPFPVVTEKSRIRRFEMVVVSIIIGSGDHAITISPTTSCPSNSFKKEICSDSLLSKLARGVVSNLE